MEQDKIISEVLFLVKLKCLCRFRGLNIDIQTQKDKDYYKGAQYEHKKMIEHLELLRWIIADIECAKSKYLSAPEIQAYEDTLKRLGLWEETSHK